MLHILTYTTPHRKTYDVLCLLKARGHDEVSVWACPMSYVKQYTPTVPHRPNFVPVDSQDYILQFGYLYTEIQEYSELPETAKDEIFLLCGGRILREEFFSKHTIINSHSGYIPYVRGLDSYKWAIYHKLPIGVTTHIVGTEIDAGEIIERRKIAVKADDTFHTVARRVYETEVVMLVDAVEKAADKHVYVSSESKPFRRMPHALEKELYHKFEEYKETQDTLKFKSY